MQSLFRILSLVFLFASANCFGQQTISTTQVMIPEEFQYRPPKEDRQFVMLKDSSIQYGSKVKPTGLGRIKVVHVDGKEIPISDVIAFQTKEGYYVDIGDHQLTKRYVEGRINVYFQKYGPNNQYSHAFLQKGNGPLQEVTNFDILKNMLMDCPKAYEMINNPPVKKGHRIVAPSYNQIVIEAYNDCGEWK
jgi:hypothetical protein